MFFIGELENEIREEKKSERMLWSFKKNNDAEKYMENVVSEQMFATYDHIPSPTCSAHGKLTQCHGN